MATNYKYLAPDYQPKSGRERHFSSLRHAEEDLENSSKYSSLLLEFYLYFVQQTGTEEVLEDPIP